MTIKTVIRAVLTTAAFLCLISCSAPDKVDGPADTLRLRLSGEPDILNPILQQDTYSSDVIDFLFRGLFKFNSDLELTPDLCQKYTVNNSGTVYTFHLDPKATWEDGTPVTAADVKFTFDKVLDPETETVRRSSFVIDGKPVRFKILDPYRIQAILPKPFAPFLVRVSMEILPKHIFESENINTSAYNRKPFGNGPFKFKEWKTGQYIILEKSESYSGPQPQFNMLLFKIISDNNTALVALEKGEIDAMRIPAKDYKKLKEQAHLKFFENPDLGYSYLGFNLLKPLFKDLKVRRAIAHAIDKPNIVKTISKGFATPAHLPSSPLLWSYPEEGSFPIYEYAPEKSTSLLEEAGYILNDKSGVVEKNGTPLSFTLLLGKGSQASERLAQVIQQYLKSVGIEMKLQLMEWQSFLSILNNPSHPKKFDAVMLAWSLSIEPDSYSLWHSSEYPKGFNFIGYNNPKVDALLIKGRQEPLQEKRAPIYHNLYKEIATDVPYVFISYPTEITAVNKRVKGLSKPSPAGLFYALEKVTLNQ